MNDTRMRASRTILVGLVTGLAAMIAAAHRVGAQTLTFPYPYPANDAPLTLPPGIVVHTRNLVVFRGHNVSALTVVIQTPTPAADSNRVAREALDVATLHDSFARSNRIDHIIVEVCRTQPCLEMREQPAEMFQFNRTVGGKWISDGRRPR